MREHKHLGFKRLEHRIEHEYERKGVPKETAILYGKETAAKVFKEQQHPNKLLGHPLHQPHNPQHLGTHVLPPHHPQHHCKHCGVLH